MYRESLKSKIVLLKDGVNEYSADILNYMYACINNAMFWRIPFRGISMPQFQCKHRRDWKKEKKTVKRKYRELGIEKVSPEIFYFHHGLRFASENILRYIKDKDILDCGAYVGDSVLVLKPYTTGTIYSFEFSQKAITEFRKVMEKNSIRSGSVLIEAALGDRIAILNVVDTGKDNNNLRICSEGEDVRMTTVDEEVKNREIKVGFIKADLEGYGFKMIKGAIGTIKTQRPVLSIGIYHNYEELFEVKPFLQRKLKNYEFEFQLHRFSRGEFAELTLFCYPQELISGLASQKTVT
jgi:FkbM family methyltransferase